MNLDNLLTREKVNYICINMSTFEFEEDLKTRLAELKKYDFNFENLVLCGGGIKTLAFIGGIMVLDDLGILQKCKRFAATSGGSLIAALLALDINIPDLKSILYSSMKEKIFDHSYGFLSLVPNVVRRYGWNPSDKLQQYVESCIEEHTGNPKITFLQAYRRYKKELCIVATNVSTMSVAYFHHKTTPDVPIIIAIRSSGALPGIVQPVFTTENDFLSQCFVDGGLAANFPLHAFDGWYFSMAPEDSFFNKLGEDEPPFGTFNPKTLGYILYTASEAEFVQAELHKRQKQEKLKRPNTRLAKAKQEACEEILRENAKRHELVEAGRTFMNALKDLDREEASGIPFIEFKQAFDKIKDDEDIKLLFGEQFNVEEVFRYLDKDTDGKVTFHEFLVYMQEKGANIRVLLEGGFVNNIQNLGQFYGTLLETILTMTQKLYVKELDKHRTIGVYNDYVDMIDFDLVDEDRDFLMRQGMVGSIAYFEDLVRKYRSQQLPKEMLSSVNAKHEPGSITDCVSSLMTTLANSWKLNWQESPEDFHWGVYQTSNDTQDKEDTY